MLSYNVDTLIDKLQTATMENQVTCACGRKIKAISLKQHEKTRIHQVGMEIAKAIAKKNAAEKEREAAKENLWVSEVLNNIAQTKREIKAVAQGKRKSYWISADVEAV
jgi:hypothetical protein